MRFIIAAFAAVVAVVAQVDPNEFDLCTAQCAFQSAMTHGCRGMMDKECVCRGYVDTQYKPYMTDVLACLTANGCGTMLPVGNILSLCDNPTVCTGPNFAECDGFCYDTRFQANPCAPPPAQNVSSPVCAENERACRTGKTSHVCIDTKNDAASCGGCPGKAGIDCASLPGVTEVNCVKGKCRAKACAEGLELVDGKCT